MKHFCPALGKLKIAEKLARAGSPIPSGRKIVDGARE
jgi:hypothetical protein